MLAQCANIPFGVTMLALNANILFGVIMLINFINIPSRERNHQAYIFIINQLEYQMKPFSGFFLL